MVVACGDFGFKGRTYDDLGIPLSNGTVLVFFCCSQSFLAGLELQCKLVGSVLKSEGCLHCLRFARALLLVEGTGRRVSMLQSDRAEAHSRSS